MARMCTVTHLSLILFCVPGCFAKTWESFQYLCPGLLTSLQLRPQISPIAGFFQLVQLDVCQQNKRVQAHSENRAHASINNHQKQHSVRAEWHRVQPYKHTDQQPACTQSVSVILFSPTFHPFYHSLYMHFDFSLFFNASSKHSVVIFEQSQYSSSILIFFWITKLLAEHLQDYTKVVPFNGLSVSVLRVLLMLLSQLSSVSQGCVYVYLLLLIILVLILNSC